MSVSVVVVPGFFVAISAVFGGDFLHGGLEVVIDQARLEFRCRNPGGGTDDENRGRPGRDVAGGEALPDLLGYVQNVVVAPRINLELMRFDGHARECTR
jgi:hypothetical protein